MQYLPQELLLHISHFACETPNDLVQLSATCNPLRQVLVKHQVYSAIAWQRLRPRPGLAVLKYLDASFYPPKSNAQHSAYVCFADYQYVHSRLQYKQRAIENAVQRKHLSKTRRNQYCYAALWNTVGNVLLSWILTWFWLIGMLNLSYTLWNLHLIFAGFAIPLFFEVQYRYQKFVKSVELKSCNTNRYVLSLVQAFVLIMLFGCAWIYASIVNRKIVLLLEPEATTNAPYSWTFLLTPMIFCIISVAGMEWIKFILSQFPFLFQSEFVWTGLSIPSVAMFLFLSCLMMDGMCAFAHSCALILALQMLIVTYFVLKKRNAIVHFVSQKFAQWLDIAFGNA